MTDPVSSWLAAFQSALDARNIGGVTALFEPQCYWRDMLAFTWNIKTLESPLEIGEMLAATLVHTDPQAFAISGPSTVNANDVTSEAWITFETRLGRGQGHVRVRNGRCWTLLTRLVELKGHEEKAGTRREKGVEHVATRSRRTWLDTRLAEEAELGVTRQPYCVIIGGGQGGLALGARLKRLGVPTIILEKNARAGDSWRRRYKSLCLHDPVWYDHLPYLPFPDHWPVFMPKDKLGDWLEMYAKVMELDLWTSAECVAARFDESAREWTVDVRRGSETHVLRPKHLIFATGMSGVPHVPTFAGASRFAGDQMHSSRYYSGAAWAGKRAVVVGSNNSAHDIAADLWENAADVTMLQRSPTMVARSESLEEHGWGKLYSEAALARGITTEIADMMMASIPLGLFAIRQKPVYDAIRAADAAFYDQLQKAGFQLTFGEDGSGIHTMYLRRGSGYYIDVGASQLVAGGRIKLKSGVEIRSLNETGVVLADGSTLPADLLVYATGYESMNGWVASLVGQDMADKVGKVWGLGSGTTKDPGPWEGELRNMWKPTRQEGLWFHGGNLFQSRFYSLTLALQLKARFEGLQTPVFGLPPVHHVA